MNAITPYPYQVELLDRGRAVMKRGVKRFILVLATGGGKTVVASSMIQAAVAKGKRVLFTADRKEHINQTVHKLDKCNVDLGVIMAGHPRWRPHAPVQVASRQTMIRRLHASVDFGNFDIIVEDECHHTRAASSELIRHRWPDAYVVGLTATPCRLDGKGLGEVYEELVVGPGVRELIELGALVDFHGFAYERPNLTKVKKVHGDYNIKELDTVMRTTVLGGSVVRDYLENARGLRALAFAVNVEHSHAMVEQALAAGVPAVHIDADTPDEQREAVFGNPAKGDPGQLARGEVLFVSQVGVATEGTDIPAIECIILARPTASVVLAKQMPGRGLRTWCFHCMDRPTERCTSVGHRVKQFCRMHDHAGVFETHGLPDDDVSWTLSGDPPKIGAPRQRRKCPKCKAMVAANQAVCFCGHVFTNDEGIQQTQIIEKQTERLSIDELRRRRPKGTRELTNDQLLKVHRATRDEKASEYLRLLEIVKHKGLKEGFALHAYRETFGVWPRFKDDELANVTPSKKPFIPLPPRRQQ